MNVISVGSYSNSRGVQAVSSTETSWIGAPKVDLDGIVRALGAQYDSFHQVYTLPCTAAGLPDMVLTIGGKNYSIPQSEYILDVCIF